MNWGGLEHSGAEIPEAVSHTGAAGGRCSGEQVEEELEVAEGRAEVEVPGVVGEEGLVVVLREVPGMVEVLGVKRILQVVLGGDLKEGPLEILEVILVEVLVEVLVGVPPVAREGVPGAVGMEAWVGS